jgi:antitoxin ParD1/3/4
MREAGTRKAGGRHDFDKISQAADISEMRPAMNVTLTAKQKSFIKRKIDAGAYANATEVVHEALRLLQEYDDLRRLKLDRLRQEIAKGEADIAAGRFESIKDDKELAAFFASL